jgi:hypothetical protein
MPMIYLNSVALLLCIQEVLGSNSRQGLTIFMEVLYSFLARQVSGQYLTLIIITFFHIHSTYSLIRSLISNILQCHKCLDYRATNGRITDE